MDLQKTKAELEAQLKELEINYHRIGGALALINDLIKQTDGGQQDITGSGNQGDGKGTAKAGRT